MSRGKCVAVVLVMYLDGEAVRELFLQCAVISGGGSRMAFSYIPTGADGRPDAGSWTGLMLWLQRVAGEPWLWSIRPEKLGPFLQETGWRCEPPLAETAEKQGVEYFAVATH
jgi:O-methyltransferase involved in polyketide biosynthesis